MGRANARVGEKVWLRRVTAWRKSGQKQTPWCQANGIDPASFSRWRIKLDTVTESQSEASIEAMRSGFISVNLADGSTGNSESQISNANTRGVGFSDFSHLIGGVSVTCNRFRIEFPSTVDVGYISQLLLVVSRIE